MSEVKNKLQTKAAAAPAEKRLKIACVYHSSFAACCAVGHMKCPIFDTKYTDRKNRVKYA